MPARSGTAPSRRSSSKSEAEQTPLTAARPPRARRLRIVRVPVRRLLRVLLCRPRPAQPIRGPQRGPESRISELYPLWVRLNDARGRVDAWRDLPRRRPRRACWRCRRSGPGRVRPASCPCRLLLYAAAGPLDRSDATALAAREGLYLPLAESAASQYDRMVAIGLGEIDKSGISELTFRSRRGKEAFPGNGRRP